MQRPDYVETGTGPAHLKRNHRIVGLNHRVLSGRNSPHTLDDLVEDCRAVMDTLAIRTSVLGGMSLGGFMAIPFALKYPERLDGLVLIATTSTDYPKSEQDGFMAKFMELDIDGMVPRIWADWVAPYVWGETTMKKNKTLVDHWTRVWTSSIPARSVWHQGLAWIRKPDDTARLSRIKVPTLVIHGEEDHPIPIERAARMAKAIPNCKFVRVAGAGHTCNLENPAPVNRALAEFLREVYAKR